MIFNISREVPGKMKDLCKISSMARPCNGYRVNPENMSGKTAAHFKSGHTGDTVASVPDGHNRANVAIKQVK